VLGDIGGGKSSLIAAVAARLEPDHFCVRIRSPGRQDEWSRVVFARHLAEETLEALRRSGSRPQRRRLKPVEKKLAESSKRSTGGHALGSRGSQVKAAAEEVTRQQQPTQILSSLDELIAVAADHGRPLLIVLEDTDSLMPPKVRGVDDEQNAETFISEVLPFLARDLACPSFVAVHRRYRDQIADLPVERIHIPTFTNHPDALAALAEIIVRYLSVAGLHASAEDLFEHDALVWLAATMTHDGDVRKALHAVDDAVVKALKEDPEAEQVPLAVAQSVATA
jgi:hypothetical protein